MDNQQIKSLLAAELPDCEIAVTGDNGKYQVMAVGQVFEGLSAVKRQQRIYSILGDHIASGAIHAVTMRLLTPAEHGPTS
ncbi:MAG: hypothetical protein RLZZ385_437 [Pseudomonadota bacterium]